MTSSLPIQEPSLRKAQRANADLPMTSAFARTLRSFAEREQLDLTQTSFVAVEELPKKPEIRPRAVGAPLTAGTSAKKKEEKIEPAVTPVEPAAPTKAPEQLQMGGLLTRGWAWLKKNNKFATTKQLRVAETISLGEKRFVSVIQVEGQKFLIGGGASGVTLLTQLDKTQTTADALQTIANAGEHLK